ncbi:MAG: hypothetical protein JJE55_12660 [Flavobacteriaceae bacterium]|nr:hypothetical protein [Flavobacteriaceae bacterium]
MGSTKFRLFGGPNGSGKSTLIEQIGKQYPLGYIVNADVILNRLTTTKYIECSSLFPRVLNNEEWIKFVSTNANDVRIADLNIEKLYIKDNIFVSKGHLNSYHAAFIASFFREKLLHENNSFSFETVMSHPSKLDFLKQAKAAGFKTYLYFICTQDPEINKGRVLNRSSIGGHDVKESKIEPRYYRSLDLLFDAFNLADRAFIMDSTSENRTLFIEKNYNELILPNENIPAWIERYILDKL